MPNVTHEKRSVSIKKFLDDILFKRFLLIIGLLILQTVNTLVIQSEHLKMILTILFLLSVVNYLLRSYRSRPLDRRNGYNKLVLITIQFIQLICYISLWVGLEPIFIYFKMDEYLGDISMLYNYLISLNFFISVFAILLGMQASKFIVIIGLLMLGSVVLAGFDIKWWALITSMLALFNYIHSKDFIVFLKQGRSVNRVPRELERKWQRNRLTIYVSIIVLYISLLMSSFQEKSDMTIWDKAKIRLDTLTFILITIFVIITLGTLIMKHAHKNTFLAWLKKVTRLDKLENYLLLHKLAAMNKGKKKRRRTR